jgi:hypothetical protein
MTHNFEESLAWSKGQACSDDLLTIKAMISGCATAELASGIMDCAGVDYIATLRKGARILIDTKNRRKGCARHWKSEPDLALEIWSVRPNGKYHQRPDKAKIGWTLNETSLVDLILFKFDPDECKDVYLVSYQLLRMAFVANFHKWKAAYKNDIQDNGRFESEAVFVPVSVILSAITESSKGRLTVGRNAP